jgi:hypothetical protein
MSESLMFMKYAGVQNLGRYFSSILVFLGFLGGFSQIASAQLWAASSENNLLESAARDFHQRLSPYAIALPDDTFFYHWTHQISKADQVSKYIQDVTSDFGSPEYVVSENWEGPGLYFAQDGATSMTYGHYMILARLKKSSELLYSNAAFPVKVEKDSAIAKWLQFAAQKNGKSFDLSKDLTPKVLSDIPGGAELVRKSGFGGFLYDWNWAHAPKDCDQQSSIALNLVDPSIIEEAKGGDLDILETSFSELKAHGEMDFAYSRLLYIESYAEDNSWNASVSSEDFSNYTKWKHSHILLCQHPYIRERFRPEK